MSARLLKDPATVSSRIFVGHLQTDDMTKHELEEHFSKYGTIVGSLINRGFGFVQFEEEQSAQKAIQNENGAMFKGRRIDVRPAKKDSQSGNNNTGGGGGGNNSGGINNPGSIGASSIGTVGSGPGKPLGSSNNQFGSTNNHFNNANDSFGSGNPSFSSGNQGFNNSNPNLPNDNQFIGNLKGNNSVTSPFIDGNQSRDSTNDQFGNLNQLRGNNNDQFNNSQNRNSNQFGPGNQNRSGTEPFGSGPGNQNRGSTNLFGLNTNQNRPGSNQNRNQNISGGNQNSGSGGGGGTTPGGGGGRLRGTRGGKNRNKNRDNSSGNNFRDRSPINRSNRIDDKTGRDWDHKPNDRLRSNAFGGRDSFNDSNSRYDDFKNSGPRDMNINFGNSSNSDYPTIAAEKNDCEIIVVNKALTEYAEAIEMRLKKVGLTVDLLFPNEDVLLSRVLGNIASRGCLYAVVVTPINQEHHSLTLNILHGLPQEHRNMPVEDAINLISRDFANYKAGGRSVPLNTPLTMERHPDAIQVLLNMLADNRQLTVLQYDRVIKYLEVKREEQVQVELGDAKDLPATTTLTVNDPKQAELQSRILNILNSNKSNSSAPVPSPVPAPTPAPAPVPPANWGTASTNATSASTTSTTTTGVSPSPLLNDPTVQKALDSLLQGNLLKSIGDQQPPSPAVAVAAAAAPTPLFAAFPNIGRF
ncbi:PREDICTED: nuclear receptor coactivator 5 isoform X2 [Polistes canadensis]|uniref:nuclear receptor coactivator 5 isoform X2 n=1 Tax=Polistes canadensis TaxID=91411 RepID=UPI000718C7B0|nr:PREDICTED: nuclear receptor coactivator 5 isoform X2 [Polistes canadensis]